MEQDKRQRYKGICPECGREMWICKNIFMEIGINQGAGRCLQCKTFLSIRFNEEKQEMEFSKFEGGSSHERRENSEEEAESGQESGGNIGGYPGFGGHNMQNNGGKGAGGGSSERDSTGNRDQGAPS